MKSTFDEKTCEAMEACFAGTICEVFDLWKNEFQNRLPSYHDGILSFTFIANKDGRLFFPAIYASKRDNI